ncbi:hypothetical protein TNCV_1326121 [Trichonephila clavipes]|nr:hypothetical protein TNCV_1326121 [Trichonephila clavipes]
MQLPPQSLSRAFEEEKLMRKVMQKIGGNPRQLTSRPFKPPSPIHDPNVQGDPTMDTVQKSVLPIDRGARTLSEGQRWMRCAFNIASFRIGETSILPQA